MSFNDIFASTKINDQLSFSIDEFESVIACLLIVPDKNKRDHDHIQFNTVKDLHVFRNILHKKGGNYQNLGYYRFETFDSPEKDKVIQLDINELYDNNVNLLYSVHLTKEDLLAIRTWVDEFSEKTQEELINKYKEDVKRNWERNNSRKI